MKCFEINVHRNILGINSLNWYDVGDQYEVYDEGCMLL